MQLNNQARQQSADSMIPDLDWISRVITHCMLHVVSTVQNQRWQHANSVGVAEVGAFLCLIDASWLLNDAFILTASRAWIRHELRGICVIVLSILEAVHTVVKSLIVCLCATCIGSVFGKSTTMKLLTSILFLLTLLNVAKGWSPPSSSGSRREFLSKSIAASAGGAAILAGQAFIGVEPSAAAAATPSTADLVQPHSLDDKVMVITGGTTGLGLESAKMLAAGGATVVLTARSETKGEKAIQMVQE